MKLLFERRCCKEAQFGSGCDVTIHLKAPLLVDRDSVLDGAGHDVTLSGDDAARILQVSRGVTLGLLHLNLTGGHDDGNAPGHLGPNGAGGAIYNGGGAVWIEDVHFTGNRATGFHSTGTTPGGDASGADIYSENGFVTARNASFAGSTTSGGRFQTFTGPLPSRVQGGAIFASNGVLRLLDVRFTDTTTIGGTNLYTGGGNGGPCYGGVIYTTNAELSVKRAVFQNYRCQRGFTPFGFMGDMQGGALHVGGGSATLENCSFATNYSGFSSSRLGGAIFNNGVLTLTDSTLSDNLVQGQTFRNIDPPYELTISAGGAIYNKGTATIRRCTLFANSSRGGGGGGSIARTVRGSDGQGGAIFSEGPLIVENCTFVQNFCIGGDGVNFPGVYSAGGHAMGERFTPKLRRASISAHF